MNHEVRWLASYEEDGFVHFRVGRRADQLVAEWRDLATLVACVDGSRHELLFVDGVSPAVRKKLENGSARLLLRSLTGELGLHGAAVSFGEHALILLGASGRGKSTLAAALCERGARLLADDAVALVSRADGVSVDPTEGDHWLDEGARAALAFECSDSPAHLKAAVPATRRALNSARVCAIVDLAWTEGDDRPRATRQRGVAALARVLPQLARFVIDSPSHHRRELDRLEHLIEHVSVYVLERPRRWGALGSTVDTIRELCLNEGETR